MGLRLRLFFLCLVFAFAFAITPSLAIRSRDEVIQVAAAGRRSLKVSTDDYSDPSANKGHDPRIKTGGGGGRKSKDTP